MSNGFVMVDKLYGVNEVSIRYEPVLAGSHFSGEPLGLRSNCFKKNLQNLPILVQGLKFFERTSSPVLDLVLHISRPPIQGSFKKT
jgi:hypothetical protein